MDKKINQKILKFWNERASLNETAGTNDFILSRIEQKFLSENIEKHSRVLDIGCGNGNSLLGLVKSNSCHGIGIDFSEKMLNLAKKNCDEQNLNQAVRFHQRDLPPIPREWDVFDVAYSQRCLINLTTTEKQKEAVLSIENSLKHGGRYIMIECFNDGLQETNHLRAQMSLEEIPPPWHNHFFDIDEVKSWSTPKFYVERVVHISSTYHFLSRVVYAKLAADANKELHYDSEINLLAEQLPQEIGAYGPVKACIWKKA